MPWSHDRTAAKTLECSAECAVLRRAGRTADATNAHGTCRGTSAIEYSGYLEDINRAALQKAVLTVHRAHALCISIGRAAMPCVAPRSLKCVSARVRLHLVSIISDQGTH